MEIELHLYYLLFRCKYIHTKCSCSIVNCYVEEHFTMLLWRLKSCISCGNEMNVNVREKDMVGSRFCVYISMLSIGWTDGKNSFVLSSSLIYLRTVVRRRRRRPGLSGAAAHLFFRTCVSTSFAVRWCMLRMNCDRQIKYM